MARNAVRRSKKEVRLSSTHVGPSWGLFVDKLVGPGREAGEPAHWSWLIAGV